LEVFANKNDGFYTSRTNGNGASLSLRCETDLRLSLCPEDPRYDDDNTYIYKYQSDGTGSGNITATRYVLWGKLENTTDYWVLCSDGRISAVAQSGFSVGSGSCPL
jgi:hypothetical protein